MANTTTQFTIKINGTNQLVELNDLLQTNVRSLGDLKEQQDLLQQAFDQADYGSAAFNQLQSSLRDVNSEIKTVEESIEGLTFSEKLQGAAQAVGAVGSAFAFASTSVQAFGDENGRTAEEIQKLETKIQAIQQGFTTFSELTASFTEKNGLFKRSLDFIGKGFNAAGIGATGFGKVTRIAIASTGIGLLITAIGLIASNFDKIKEKIAPLIKALDPLFNTLRNIASFFTGGLIDNATTNAVATSIEETNKRIEKIQIDADKKLDNLSKLSAGRFETALTLVNKQAEVQAKKIADTYEETKKGLESVFKTIIKLNEDGSQLFADPELANDAETYISLIKAVFATTEEGSTESQIRIQGLILEFDRLTKGLKEGKDSSSDFFSALAEQPTLVRDLQNFIDESTPKLVDGLSKLADIQTKGAEIQSNISQRSLEIQKLRTSVFATEVENYKELVLFLTQITKLASTKGTDVLFEQINAQLKNLARNVQIPEIQAIFNGKFFKDLKESKGGILFSGEQLFVIEQINEYLKQIDNLTTKQLTDLATQLDIQGALEEKTKIILKDSVTTVTTGGDLVGVFEAINKEVDSYNLTSGAAFKQGTREILSSVAKIAREFINIKTEVIFANKELEKYNKLLEFDKAIESIDRFKSGVKLSVDEIDRLAQILPDIDFTQALAVQPFEKQNEILKEIAQKEIDLANERLTTNLKFVKTTGEANNLIKDTNKQIEEITKNTNDTLNANNLLKKQYQDQLDILEEQYEIDKLLYDSVKPIKTYKQKLDATNKVLEAEQRQSKLIEERFEKETEGLAESDERYKISAKNKEIAIEKLGIETKKRLEEIDEEFFVLITDNILNIKDSIQQIFDSVYQGQTEAIDRQITLNQYAIDTLTEQISAIQEQISFIDEIINKRKQAIDELQAAAETATGGQREEILKQLDAEVKRTKDLVKEKKALQKQEENAVKSQQKLEKENQKLAAQSIVIQAKQAVAAQVLGIAQTGVAIATIAASSARQDFTFGIATVASIIAVTAALTANIIGIASSLKNLKVAQENPLLKAEGGYTGASTLRPDETGEKPMYHTVQLHEQEWVAPRWMTQSPKYGSLINELEQTRVRGFAQGGSPVPLRQIDVDANQEINLLLRANLNKPVFVAVTDINDGQSRVNVIENRARF